MAERCAYVIGGGGHAHVLASLINGRVRFAVPRAAAEDEMPQDEFFEEIERYRGSDIYIGIGDNAVRRRYFDLLKALRVPIATCVAPSAFVARDAELGEGAVICAGAVIGSRATIGDNVIVNTLSSVDHDCRLGRDTQVTAGVTVAGGVDVGDNCFFGVKSAVIPGVSIGRDVKVMAGALVTGDLPQRVLVGGNPARIVRALGAVPAATSNSASDVLLLSVR